MESPSEPLEDVLADNWDKDMSIDPEGTGEAEVQRKNKKAQSPEKPNIETEYIRGIGGKPPKVHLTEKLEVVYSRSLGDFDTLNVETTAAIDNEEEDTITSLRSPDSFYAESVDSASIESVLSADQKLVRVEDNVMSLLNKMQDRVANMEESLRSNFKNVERCGAIADVADRDDSFSDEEDSATLNTVMSPFSGGSDTARSANSRAASDEESAHSNLSDIMDDDTAEVEALVEELEVNEIYPKSMPPRVYAPPALVPPPSKNQSEHKPEISPIPKVESSSSFDMRKGSAWFKKLATRPFTPPPGNRSSSPALLRATAKKQDVITSTRKKVTPPKLKPSPRETSNTRKSRKSSISKVNGTQTEASAAATKDEVVGSTTHVDTPVNQSEDTTAPSVGQSLTKVPTLKVVNTSMSDRKSLESPIIIPCPAITRSISSSRDTQRNVTLDDRETHASPEEVYLAMTQIDPVNSTVADEEDLKSKANAAVVASGSTIATLLAPEKAPRTVSGGNDVESNDIQPDDGTVLSGIEYPIDMMDMESKTTDDEQNSLPAVGKASQDSIPARSAIGGNRIEGVEPVVDIDPGVKELVEKWEKAIPKATDIGPAPAVDDSINDPMYLESKELVDANESDEGFEYTLDSVENDRAMERALSVIEASSARECNEDVEATMDDEAGIEYTLGTHEQFAGPSQDAKSLVAPIAVDGDQNDSVTDDEAEAEAEENIDKAISKSPSRKRVPGRSIMVKKPKRISSIWKKRQKKDATAVEDVISPTEDTDDIANRETSDESESVQSNDIETKHAEESVVSVSVDETVSVDKDPSKKDQPAPESPSAVTDIILGMTETELASEDFPTGGSSRVVESDQPKAFVLGASTNDCDVVPASANVECAPERKEVIEPTPISPSKSRSRVSLFRRRSHSTKELEDTIVQESEAASEKGNGGTNVGEDEAVMLVDKAAALLKERSSESLLSERAIPESALNGMVDEHLRSLMDSILGKTATEPPSPDRTVAGVKISVMQQSEPMVSSDTEKVDEGPLPWMQVLPDEVTSTAGDGELQECSIDHEESEEVSVNYKEKEDEENKELESATRATTRKKRKKFFWKRRKSTTTESQIGTVAAETSNEEDELVDPQDDLHVDDESLVSTSTSEDDDESIEWETMANDAAEAAISASEWVGVSLGIVDGDDASHVNDETQRNVEGDDVPHVNDKETQSNGEEQPKTNRGRLFHIPSFGRSASSSSAAKGLPSGIPLEDGIKLSRGRSRSLPRRSNQEEIARTTGSSSTQKRDNRGLGRIFTGRRSRSKDASPIISDISVNGSMEPLLLDGKEDHDAGKMKRKKTKIVLHRKRYTDLEDDESKEQLEEECPERNIVTPPNCYDCPCCLPPRVPSS